MPTPAGDLSFRAYPLSLARRDKLGVAVDDGRGKSRIALDNREAGMNLTGDQSASVIFTQDQIVGRSIEGAIVHNSCIQAVPP